MLQAAELRAQASRSLKTLNCDSFSVLYAFIMFKAWKRIQNVRKRSKRSGRKSEKDGKRWKG